MAKGPKANQKAEARAPLIGDPIIAHNIRRGLDAAGMLPADLAGRLKLTRQAVGQWVNAQTTPGARRLRQIAKVLKVSVEFLRQAPQAVAQPPRKTVAQPPAKIVAQPPSKAVAQPRTVEQPTKRDRTVRLRAYPLGGLSDESTLAGRWPLPAEWFQGLASDQADLLAMRVTGSDLIPDFVPGELVIVDRSWHVVSVAGFYLTGNRSFPILRRCELVAGPKAQVRIYEHGGERVMPANDLPIFGRVICKWLLPM
jgi:transcriptional regulator with XRE-family HTH domain